MFTQPSGVIILIVTQSQSCSFIGVRKKKQQAISEVHVHIQFKCGTNSVATNTVW